MLKEFPKKEKGAIRIHKDIKQTHVEDFILLVKEESGRCYNWFEGKLKKDTFIDEAYCNECAKGSTASFFHSGGENSTEPLKRQNGICTPVAKHCFAFYQLHTPYRAVRQSP